MGQGQSGFSWRGSLPTTVQRPPPPPPPELAPLEPGAPPPDLERFDGVERYIEDMLLVARRLGVLCGLWGLQAHQLQRKRASLTAPKKNWKTIEGNRKIIIFFSKIALISKPKKNRLKLENGQKSCTYRKKEMSFGTFCFAKDSNIKS